MVDIGPVIERRERFPIIRIRIVKIHDDGSLGMAKPNGQRDIRPVHTKSKIVYHMPLSPSFGFAKPDSH